MRFGLLGWWAKRRLSPFRLSKSSQVFSRGENRNAGIFSEVEQVMVSRDNHLSAGHYGAFYKHVIIGIVENHAEITGDFDALSNAAQIVENGLNAIL